MPLVGRTLGLGKASCDRLKQPKAGSAVFVWQGIIDDAKSKVRVQIPVPLEWLERATNPVMRFYVAYDPPVNVSAQEVWACREVSAVLKVDAEADGLRGSQRKHKTYPLSLKEYKLKNYAPSGEKAAPSDMWVVELKYDEIFDYPPGMDFSPAQRVAIAGELVDDGEDPADPQPFVQRLPAAMTMNHLSVPATQIRAAVVLRSR